MFADSEQLGNENGRLCQVVNASYIWSTYIVGFDRETPGLLQRPRATVLPRERDKAISAHMYLLLGVENYYTLYYNLLP